MKHSLKLWGLFRCLNTFDNLPLALSTQPRSSSFPLYRAEITFSTELPLETRLASPLFPSSITSEPLKWTERSGFGGSTFLQIHINGHPWTEERFELVPPPSPKETPVSASYCQKKHEPGDPWGGTLQLCPGCSLHIQVLQMMAGAGRAPVGVSEKERCNQFSCACNSS